MNGYNPQTKQELEEIIRGYQTNNRLDLYELKVLHETDEAENIYIFQNTIFIGTNKMQIKKLDGTIEKYKIEKYYPVDERDKELKELRMRVAELEKAQNERRMSDEYTEHVESITECDKSNVNANGDVES